MVSSRLHQRHFSVDQSAHLDWHLLLVKFLMVRPVLAPPSAKATGPPCHYYLQLGRPNVWLKFQQHRWSLQGRTDWHCWSQCPVIASLAARPWPPVEPAERQRAGHSGANPTHCQRDCAHEQNCYWSVAKWCSSCCVSTSFNGLLVSNCAKKNWVHLTWSVHEP